MLPKRKPLPEPAANERIAAVRRFNRFYTQRIGLLAESWAGSPFTLAEARVLYEIVRHDRTTAKEIAQFLGLDAGYLSRMLRRFEQRDLIARKPSATDARQSLLSMTARGRRAFAPCEQRSNDDVAAMLATMSDGVQANMLSAMTTIETSLAPETTRAPYILRPPRPGDYGWIVARHGEVYSREYGWDGTIEALTAEIVAAFVRNFDPKRECCWIAERNGVNAGCVFIVRENDTTARLRLLLVDEAARGLGIGARLVDECVRFARNAGYGAITLWTHSVLTGARHIYERAGFRLTREWTHDDFGKLLHAETWDLDLNAARQA